MADARTLLKAQRTTRRIAHPNAVNTESGKLLCSLCHVAVKSNSLWSTHLKSAQHLASLQAASQVNSAEHNGKKRKADLEVDENLDDVRKKARTPDAAAEDVNHDQTNPDMSEGPLKDSISKSGQLDQAPTDTNPSELLPSEQEQIDFQAFQRELDAEEALSAIPNALNAGPTISAAPVTVAELAAQARQDLSTQTDDKTAILEAEKEDATRALEDEFEQMEELEARLQKLRKQRESIKHTVVSVGKEESIASTESVGLKGQENAHVNGQDNEDDEDEDDEEDVDEDFAIWNFGAK